LRIGFFFFVVCRFWFCFDSPTARALTGTLHNNTNNPLTIVFNVNREYMIRQRWCDATNVENGSATVAAT
jgi:hypothetical protein